jgi:hypothetical protein
LGGSDGQLSGHAVSVSVRDVDFEARG